MAFGKHCPRFAEYQALYPTSVPLQKALCDFHASIVRCCKHVVEVMQRPCIKHTFVAVDLAIAYSKQGNKSFKKQSSSLLNKSCNQTCKTYRSWVRK